MNAQLSFQLVQLALKFLFDVGTHVLSNPKQNHPLRAGGVDYLPNRLCLALVGQCVFHRLAHQRRRGYRTEPGEVLSDLSVTRDHKTLWNIVAAIDTLHQWLCQSSVIPKNFVIDFLCLNELSHPVKIVTFVVCSRHTDYNESARLVFVVQLHEIRHFHATRSTPGSPKIYHHHLVLEIG